MRRAIELEIRDSVFDPDRPPGQAVRYRKLEQGASKFSYCVYAWLDGPDLAFVEQVRWYLHESFPQREVVTQRSAGNQRCKLTLWTWGIFEIKAIVALRGRPPIELIHRLGYDRELARADLKFELG